MMILSFLFLMISARPALALDPPSWAKDLPEARGTALTVSCHGEGPDRDLAFSAAMDECRGIASTQLQNSFQIKTLSVQTERDAALHEEVSTQMAITGLTCKVKNKTEESTETHAELWLKCEFDTKTAKAVPASNNPQARTPANQVSTKRLIYVVAVPQCESIVITGKNGRVVRCNSNPLPVLINPGDDEMILRKEGYRPKHVRIGSESEVSVLFGD